MEENVFELAVIPGDGIGSEVTAAALEVLRKASAGTGFNVKEYDLGARRYQTTGETLDDGTLADIKKADAIVLGAIGDPAVPSGLLERDLLLKLRFELDHYVNLRPARLYLPADSPLSEPGEVDFVVVREGTEGAYTGNGGAMRVGTDAEVATEVSLNTAFGVRRLVEYAFEQAENRTRTREVPKKVTLVHKHNVLVHAGHLWRRVVEDVALGHPDVGVDYLHVDAATIFMVTDPGRFDVIVTDNLFGDIITDLAAAVTGGIGLAASANINPERKTPSMFEPVHGSAPDVAGRGIADPTAAILSMAMLCEFLGEKNPPLHEAAQAIRAAVGQDLTKNRKGRKRSTEAVTASVLELV